MRKATELSAEAKKFRLRLERNRNKYPHEVLQAVEEALTKLAHSNYHEFYGHYNYLDWLTTLPWGIYSADNLDTDIIQTQKILDEDHYGLTDVKERILEFIAVGKLSGSFAGKIICLHGPPGVGKTSLGSSIARALNQLLDPLQNANFLDHYLGVPMDLSKVLFVCTVINIDNIPAPLLDRMEVIAITGYSTDEKMHIAINHLEKFIRKQCGIKPEHQVLVTDATLRELIENYCKEPEVRNLQMHIEKIYRKIALQLVRQGTTQTKLRYDEDIKGGLKLLLQPASKIVDNVLLVDSYSLYNFIGEPVSIEEPACCIKNY